VDTAVIALLAIVALLLAALVVVIVLRNRRTRHLRERFGPEYDHAMRSHEKAAQAEADLLKREQRAKQFQLRDLRSSERIAFAEEWTLVQAEFVDNPGEAITKADALVEQLMSARGYPVTDFEQQAADLSVDHGSVVNNYRIAHATVRSHLGSSETTEQLRLAMIHYREVFNELLAAPVPAH
jgi:hypothetical protein